MSRVFWDTNLFIYLIEDVSPRGKRVASLRERMIERRDQLYTSAMTLGEVLVKPLETGNAALARAYEEAIVGAAVVLPFGVDESRAYARIRRERSIRAPDAMQLACASTAGIDLFITNDDRLSNRIVEGVQFVASLEAALI